MMGLCACDPEEPIPSFIYIKPAVLSIEPGQGSASHKITDVWVYENNMPAGVFELPATVPILTQDPVTITLLPGIQVNGISATRGIYPFYSGYDENMSLDALATDTLEPVFSYSSNAVFRFVRDFETSSGFEAKDGITQLVYMTGTGEEFEGERSLKVHIESPLSGFQIGTTDLESFDVENLTDAYLELNYKCTAPFIVYLRVVRDGVSSSADILQINKKETWNKIYVNLQQAMRSSQAQFFEVGFIARQLPDGETMADFYFDNIKLIYSE